MATYGELMKRPSAVKIYESSKEKYSPVLREFLKEYSWSADEAHFKYGFTVTAVVDNQSELDYLVSYIEKELGWPRDKFELHGKMVSFKTQ